MVCEEDQGKDWIGDVGIRKDFPEVFESWAKLERKVGYSILKDKDGEPVYLDELSPNRGNMSTEIFPDCGIMCYLAEK